MKKRGETFIADDFQITEATRRWVEAKYPQIDLDATVERFCDAARAGGWMYRDWQAGLRTVIRKGMENGWRSIVTLKGGREFDPKWTRVLQEARAEGFREPAAVETPASYRTALEQWRLRPTNVVQFGSVLKRVP